MARTSYRKRYKILSLLGEGGMGTVYRAQDKRLLREVALKVMNTDLAQTEALLFFHREARAMASLRHKNVALIYDYSGPKESPMFMSMELIEGMTLMQMMHKHGVLPNTILLAILHELASALEHAHQKNVIHRDIKPSNIMIEENGRVVLMDFGIAKSYRDPQQLGKTFAGQETELRGTPEFMSPEQVMQEGIGPPSDIFALGSLAYMCACGRSPFKGSSHLDTLERVSSQERVPLKEQAPHIISPVNRLIDKCLQFDPALRPSANALVEKCASLLSEFDISNPQTILEQFLLGNYREPSRKTGTSNKKSRVKRPAKGREIESDDLSVIPEHLRAETVPVQPKEKKQDNSSSSMGPIIILTALLSFVAALSILIIFTDLFQSIKHSKAVKTPQTKNAIAEDKAKQAQALSFLTIKVKPWGTVFVDDTLHGKIAGSKQLLLKPGEHHILINHPNYGKAEKTITLEPGERMTIRIELN